MSNVNYFNCSSNRIPIINVNNNPDLTHLDCSNNNLSGLTVSNNNFNLTYINCSNNYISSLDVSNNTGLTTLYCNNNEMSIQKIDRILHDISNHTINSGILYMQNNHFPSSYYYVSALTSRGWNLQYDSTTYTFIPFIPMSYTPMLRNMTLYIILSGTGEFSIDWGNNVFGDISYGTLISGISHSEQHTYSLAQTGITFNATVAGDNITYLNSSGTTIPPYMTLMFTPIIGNSALTITLSGTGSYAIDWGNYMSLDTGTLVSGVTVRHIYDITEIGNTYTTTVIGQNITGLYV